MVMVKIGAFSFGSGWSILALMEKEFVLKRGWMSGKELTDFMAVARSLPGILAINTGVLFGYYTAGYPGAFATAIGMALAPLLSILLVTVSYTTLKDNAYMVKALNGVRAAVIPIIFTSCITMAKASVADLAGWLILIAAFLFCAFSGLSTTWAIAGGAVLGLILKNVKRDKNHDPD